MNRQNEYNEDLKDDVGRLKYQKKSIKTHIN